MVEQQFQEFNFAENQEWQSYIINLFPTPTQQQFKKIKRRWYKNHINNELQLEEPQPQQQQQQQQNQNQQQYQNQNEQQQQNQNQQNQNQQGQEQVSKWVQQIYKIEGFLKMLYFPLYFLYPYFKTQLIIIICIFALLRQLGFPRFNLDYGRRLYINEFFQNLLFLVPISMIQFQSMIFHIPIFIHLWSGTAEFIYRQQFFFYRFMAKVIDQTRSARNQLLLMKIKFEINLIFVFIVFTFARQVNWMTVIFYGMYLRTKYFASPTMQYGFTELDTQIRGIVNHRFCPSSIAWIYLKIKSFCAYLVQVPQQQQQQQ